MSINSTEKTLRVSERLYRYLYEHANEMYVSVDPKDATIIKCNQTLCNKLGYTKKELIGKSIFMLYHPECMPEVEKAFKGFKENGVVENAELILKTKEDRKIDVMLNVTSVLDENGNILYSRSSWNDITAFKRSQKELLENAKKLEIKNKELEQFVFIASHDLQEPLRTISSFTALLAKEYSGKFDETGEKSLQFITEATCRMQNLVKGLLDYSRIGKDTIMQAVDCIEMINEIKQDLGTKIKNSKTEIVVENLPRDLIAYETELRQLFQNLITNAIKFRREGINPKIKILCKQLRGQFCFSIEDNGIGISQEHQSKVFEIFKRLHNRNDYEGTGIGLAYCQKIVDLHGGNIWVESVLGKGSAFYFSVPKIVKAIS